MHQRVKAQSSFVENLKIEIRSQNTEKFRNYDLYSKSSLTFALNVSGTIEYAQNEGNYLIILRKGTSTNGH